MDLEALHAKTGELTLEKLILEHAHEGVFAERKAVINRTHRSPLARQAKTRGYRPGRGVLPAQADQRRGLAGKLRIDELRLKVRFAGCRL